MKTINSCAAISSTRSTNDRNSKRPRMPPNDRTRDFYHHQNHHNQHHGTASRSNLDQRHDEDSNSSVIQRILDRISCGPTDIAPEEPQEVCYPQYTAPPMQESPPVILYVHRYRHEPERRDPAPLPTIKSCDTDTTADDSDADSSSWLTGSGLTYDLSGRATPLVSNTSSSLYSVDSPRSLELRKSQCFDEEDMKEAPHSQAIVIDNRNLLSTQH